MNNETMGLVQEQHRLTDLFSDATVRLFKRQPYTAILKELVRVKTKLMNVHRLSNRWYSGQDE